jgi:hypothetical protein
MGKILPVVTAFGIYIIQPRKGPLQPRDSLHHGGSQTSMLDGR